MALIKRTSVEQAVDAANIVEIVEMRTPLRRVGTRYVGRCPFHEERTPSFSVNAERKLYHCFGCGAGGDLLRFVQETEGLDFVGAVEWLADRYRVELEYEEVSPQAEQARSRRDRLFGLLDAAARFYERHLWETEEGEPARSYLAERGFGQDVCREFRLGLSPGGPTLPAKARQRGYTNEELAAAGLINRGGMDYFGHRLTFPLADTRGRVVGFGARRLEWVDDPRAKYVNSPEGEVFQKASLVYGLHAARSVVAKSDRAIIVEGYTDVLALRQAGLPDVVALMGTSLTEQQLSELGRLTRRVFLCFDSDAAGEAATLRGMELALRQGFDVRVVALPPGLDPADAADEFAGRLEGAEGYLLYRVRLELQRAPSRQEAFERVGEILKAAEVSPDRDEAERLATDRLDLPPGAFSRFAPGRHRGDASPEEGPGAVSPRILEAGDRLERDALAGCIANAGLQRALAELSPEYFDSAFHRALYEHLVDGTETSPAGVELLAELDARAADEGIDEATTSQLLLQLRERHLRRQLDDATLSEATERVIKLQAALAKVRDAVRELG